MRYFILKQKTAVSILILASLLSFLTGCNEAERAAQLYTEATILNDTQEKDLAIEKLKQAIDLSSEFTLAHSMLGDIYQEVGDYNNSEQSYEKATQLNDFSFHDFFNLGKVRQVLKKFDLAAKAYVRACEIDPNNAPAHLNAARCYFEIKDDSQALENAMEYSLRAKELDPTSGDVYSLMGDIYQTRKDNALAIDSYKRSLEIEGNKPDIMISLAVSYFRAKQNDSAREVLDSVIESDKENSLAYRYLGVYYIRANDFENALKNYLMAVHFNKNDWQAHKGLGVAYMLKAISNDDSEARAMAIDHWTESMSINPRQPKLGELLNKYSK
jgi:tetratricopeptide (TPR) repeat protein